VKASQPTYEFVQNMLVQSIVVGEIGKVGPNAQKPVAEELDRASEKSNETLRMEEYHVPEVPSELLLVIHIAVQLIANGVHLVNGVDAPKPVAKEFKQGPEK